MSATKRTKTPLATAHEVRHTETDAALNAGEAIATLKLAGQVQRVETGGRPYRITEDGKVESLEGYLLKPVMRRGDVEVYDAESFVEYTNRFKTDTTVVFADKVKAAFTGILDYHEGKDGEDRAGWGRHRVGLTLRPTRQWTTWTGAAKTPMSQALFAQFLEDNIPDIFTPPGALIVEIVRTLEAKKSVVFESNIVRQTDGAFRFIYSEDVQGAAGRGTLQIPSEFQLVLRPFEGSDAVPVVARFRYRLGEGGKLSLWFELVRVPDILEEAFTKELDRIEVGVEEPVIFHGPVPARLTVE
jgi:uncharacterized protein YfdQ (DUF2303 family)